MAYRIVSESPIWDIQKNFYQEAGVDIWKDKIPFYATSNSFIANSYANVIIAYVQECINTGRIDESKTFTVMELGAGTGKFTFLLLKRLIELQVAKNNPTIKIKYLATDFVQANIDFISAHELLEPYIQNGYLETAYFDVTKNDPVFLLHSKKTISLTEDYLDENPFIIIANYVFDSLPHDIFAVTGGKLSMGSMDYHENLHSLQNNVSVGLDAIGDIVYQDIALPHFSNDIINRILHQYISEDHQGHFSIPVFALNFLKKFLDRKRIPHLLLCSDKGYHNHLFKESVSPPEITYHMGAFSNSVNFTAIGMGFTLSGGDYYAQSVPTEITTSVFITGITLPLLPDTHQVLREYLDTTGPGALLALYKVLMTHHTEMTLGQILSMLDILNWDCNSFIGCSKKIYELIATADTPQVLSLMGNLPRVYKQFYYTQGCPDLAYIIGWILQRIEQYKAALFYYELSFNSFGAHRATLFNMALCEMGLQNETHAKELFEKILHNNPLDEDAKAWIVHLQGKAANTSFLL